MRKEKTIQIGEKEICVRELTVAQIDVLMNPDTLEREPASVELVLNSSLPIECVIASTGESREYLGGELTPSEANEIWEAVSEVNDFLCQMIARLETLAGTLQQSETVSVESSVD